MSELPLNWASAGLLDIAELHRGVTYSRADAHEAPFSGSIPVLRANNIQNRRFDFNDLVHVPSNLVSDKQQIKSGDIVIATSSGSINVVGKAAQARTDIQAGFGAFCGLMRPYQEIEARYLGYFFLTDEYRTQVSSMARGVNINNLKKDHFAELSLSIAPINEQKRIADKLDAVLARVDACRDRLDRVPAILKRFRQSVLAAATSGKLTEEWRDEAGLPVPSEAVLGDCCDVLGGKRLPKGFELTDEDTGFPYIRVTNFHSHSVNVEQLRFVPKDAAEIICRYIINSDDIYISIAGTIGLVGQVPQTVSGANLTENAARIVVRDGFVPRYLMYQLASPMLQEQIRTKKIATTQEKLGLFRIKELQLVKPDEVEQTEIVRRVESLFAYADRLEARYANARAQTERLTPSLLAKAFRGELVPQDPGDEPASVLLERINAHRSNQAAINPKRSRKALA